MVVIKDTINYIPKDLGEATKKKFDWVYDSSSGGWIPGETYMRLR